MAQPPMPPKNHKGNRRWSSREADGVFPAMPAVPSGARILEDRPIDIDSRRQQEILETTKFPFKIRSHGYLTDWVTEIFEGKHQSSVLNQYAKSNENNRVGVNRRIEKTV